MAGTRVIAGLGNPGQKYERTRHNVGFRVVDEVARRLGATSWKKKDGAEQAHVAARAVVLVKPLSFMNDSGLPLGRIAGWWKAPAPGLLVISDDLDLPFGRLRMRASGGSGGHNGLKSVIAHFGEAFPRLRVGIGRGRSETIDYVLSNFAPDEERELATLVGVAADGVERWLAGDMTGAIQLVNAWRPASEAVLTPPASSEDTSRAS
ncbi:MAG: aminoacyl-tRNA hydrolase [Vulcanimicrobiaceae bacterium]